MSAQTVQRALKVIAATLLVPIGLVAWQASDRRATDAMLTSRPEAADAPHRRVERLAALTSRSMSARQQRARQDALAAALVDWLLTRVSLDGETLESRDPYRATTSRPNVQVLSDGIPAVAGLEPEWHVLVNGTRFEFRVEPQAMEIAIDAGDRPTSVRIVLVGPQDEHVTIRSLDVFRDVLPPEITWSASVGGPKSTLPTALELSPGGTIVVEAEDASGSARLEVHGAAEFELTSTTPERIVINGSRLAPGDERQVTFVALDDAGNTKRVELDLRVWRKPDPRLEAVQIGDRPVAVDRLTMGRKAVEVAFQLSGIDDDAAVAFRSSGGGTLAAQRRGDAWRIAFPVADEASESRGELVVNQGGKSFTALETTVVRDPVPPDVSVVRAADPERPLSDESIVAEADEVFLCRVVDEGDIDIDRTTLRPDGAIHAKTRSRIVNGLERPFVFSGAGPAGIEVEAVDLAGNATTRFFRFVVRSTPPDDKSGPEVRVLLGDRVVDPTRELVFWQSAPELVISLTDASGLREDALRVSGPGEVDTRRPAGANALESRLRPTASGVLQLTGVDRHGNATKRDLAVIILAGPVAMSVVDPLRMDADGTAVVGRPPLTIRVQLESPLPPGRLRLALRGPDAKELRIDVVDGSARLPDTVTLHSGVWNATTILDSDVSAVEIGSIRFIAETDEEGTDSAPADDPQNEADDARGLFKWH